MIYLQQVCRSAHIEGARYTMPPRHSGGRGRGLRVFLLFGLILTIVACGGPEIQPLQIGPIPWADGEQGVYQITDVDGNYAGTATITLDAGAATIEGDAWTLRREILAQGDQEVVIIEMTGRGLRPRLSTMVRLRGTARQQVKAVYAGGQVDLELTTAQDVTTTHRENVISDVRDYRTLMQLARVLPLQVGYATEVNSYLPITNVQERFSITVLSQERVTVPAGQYEAWKVELQTSDSESQAWLTVDTPHILVKFVEGRNGGTYELNTYRAER